MGHRRRNSPLNVKHLRIHYKNGKRYIYHRHTGARLPDLDDPGFLAAYVEQETPQRERRALVGSVRHACQSAKKTAAFCALSTPYKAMIARHFDAICDSFADLPIGGARPEHIRLDVMKAAAPQDRLKAWRYLFSFAIDNALAHTDPSLGVKPPQRAEKGGHPTWTAEDIATYRQRHQIGTVARAAFELLFWTGCRISDAVAIGRQHIDRGGVLTFTQSKTGDDAFVPWRCALPAYALDMESDRQTMHRALDALGGGRLLFLESQSGKPRSSGALGNLIREAARAAGVEKSAHGLRKARAVALVDSGATPHQVAAWTGHQTLKEIERYTRKANRRRAVMAETKRAKV